MPLQKGVSLNAVHVILCSACRDGQPSLLESNGSSARMQLNRPYTGLFYSICVELSLTSWSNTLSHATLFVSFLPIATNFSVARSITLMYSIWTIWQIKMPFCRYTCDVQRHIVLDWISAPSGEGRGRWDLRVEPPAKTYTCLLMIHQLWSVILHFTWLFWSFV